MNLPIDTKTMIIIPILLYMLTKKIYIPIAFLCFVLYFLRFPQLNNYHNYQENIFYSPTDGRVRSIEEKNDMITISLFLNIFDKHGQYIPIKSTLVNQTRFYGPHIQAYKEHAINNERVVNELIGLNNNKQFNYSITQITGILTHRILSIQKPSEQLLLPGHKLGFILLGSRVDIILPKNIIKNILVTKGQHINAMQELCNLN